MAVIENRSTALGDGLYIQTDVPILGIATLSGFIDSTVGEGEDAYFARQFRYSLDGITWSEWADLTADNIQLIPIRTSDTFFAEYQYLHEGTNPDGELAWNDTTIQGQQVELTCGPVYSQSIFAPHFSCKDVGVLTWAISVGEKLYHRGILPEFVERNKDGDGMEDRDFLDFWLSITNFFAFLVHYARGFERIAENNTLLRDYLLGFGLYTTPETTNDELLNLLENLWREFGKRGTAAMFEVDEENGRGEFLRLIDFKQFDEFFWVLAEPQQTGWNVDNCSPLYRGLTPFKQVNKFYEQEFNQYTQLENYPLTTTGAGAILPTLSERTGNRYGVQLTAKNGTTTGFQVLDEAGAETFGIAVNENISYELNVAFSYFPQGPIESNSLTVDGDPLRDRLLTRTRNKGAFFITLACFDKDHNALTPIKADRTGPATWMLENYKGGRSDVTYTHRGIMYAKNTPAIDPVEAAVGLGQHLCFPAGTRYVVPTIVMNPLAGGAGDAVIISAVRLVPIPDYSTGFVDTPNYMQFWLENRNTHLTLLKLKDLIRRYLLPYAATMQVTALEETPTIVQYPKMKFTLRLQHPSAWDRQDGLIEVQPTGGHAPYRVVWFEEPLYQDMNPLIYDLPGGVYRGVLEDSSPVPQRLAVNATLVAPTRPTAWRVKASSARCETF